jgi:hypothetical protein
VQLSNERLYEIVSPPPHCLRFQLPLACQFVHNRYGTNIAPHLLCDRTRWNPPEATIDDTGATSTANWLQIPVDQLKSRLSKVDLGIVKACCNLYLSPESPPKSKTARYTVIAGRAEGKHRPATGRCFCRGPKNPIHSWELCVNPGQPLTQFGHGERACLHPSVGSNYSEPQRHHLVPTRPTCLLLKWR